MAEQGHVPTTTFMILLCHLDVLRNKRSPLTHAWSPDLWSPTFGITRSKIQSPDFSKFCDLWTYHNVRVGFPFLSPFPGRWIQPGPMYEVYTMMGPESGEMGSGDCLPIRQTCLDLSKQQAFAKGYLYTQCENTWQCQMPFLSWKE